MEGKCCRMGLVEEKLKDLRFQNAIRSFKCLNDVC